MIYLLPDVETIAVEYLKEHRQVRAICHGRVSADIAPNATLPYITVVLIGGGVPIDRHFASPTIQLDAWAEKREAARHLAATAHAALIEMNGTQGDLGVVTGVRTLSHPRYLADPRKNRARYSLDLQLFVHRIPA